MAILAGTVAGVVVSTQQNAKNSASSSGAKKLSEQIAIFLGTPFDADDEGLIEFTPRNGETPASVEFNLTNITAELDDDNNYKNAYTTTYTPKAGVNVYNIAVSEDKHELIISFAMLGASKKYDNVFTISYDNTSDRFIVTPSVDN